MELWLSGSFGFTLLPVNLEASQLSLSCETIHQNNTPLPVGYFIYAYVYMCVCLRAQIHEKMRQ